MCVCVCVSVLVCCHVFPLHNAWPAPSLAGGLYSTHTRLKNYSYEFKFNVNLPKVEAEGKIKNIAKCVISGFHLELDDNCALLGYYAAYSGNFLPSFREEFSVLSSKLTKSLTPDEATDRLSRNVGKELPLRNNTK